MARNDWNSLNGKDLPYYIAILAVLRETTKEIFYGESTRENHSEMKTDKRGYSLASNENCEFVPLTESKKRTKWRGLYLTIRAFRNGSAHISYIKNMNPVFFTQTRNPEDTGQDYYRYAPFPSLYHDPKRTDPFDNNDLKIVHEFVKPAVLGDVRSSISTNNSSQIKYELYHVERSPFIDLLHTKMIELLKEVNVL